MSNNTNRCPAVHPGRRFILLGLLGLAIAGSAGACIHAAEQKAVAPGEEPPVAKGQEDPDEEVGRTRAGIAEEGDEQPVEEDLPGLREHEQPAERDSESPEVVMLGQAPTEIEWQVDEDGERYFVLGIPLDSPHYRWLDEEQTRIQTFYGLKLGVADRDEEAIYIRMYQRSQRPARQPGGSEDEGTETRASVASSPEEAEPGSAALLRFTPFDTGLPKTGQWRHGFDLADMNGDGHLDLVHGPPRKGNGRPAIFLGDGQGAWRPWSEARFPRERYDYGDVAVADFDGDGHQDLALAMHVRGLRVLVNDGSGRFSPWSDGLGYEGGHPGESAVFSSRAIEAVDWNGDGRPDLVVLGEGIKGRPRSDPRPEGSRAWSRGLSLFLNDGDGTWSAGQLGEDNRSFGDALALGDFNGDGNPDAVTGSMSAGSRRLVVLGDGASGGTAQRIEALPARGFVTAVATGDLDGDGLDDLVLGTTGGGGDGPGSGILVLYARPDDQGGLTWEDTTLLWRDGESLLVEALAVGDLGGSSLPDVVALSKEGEVWAFVNRGRADFVQDAGSLREPIPGCRGYHAQIVPGPDADAVLVAGFSGERTGLPGIPGVDFEGCPGQGSLEAWAVSEAEDP